MLLDIQDKLIKIHPENYSEEIIELKKKGMITVNIEKQMLKLFHIKSIFDFYPKLSDILKNYIWIFYLNKTNESFFTSDNPVIQNSYFNFGIWGNAGIFSKGIEYIFPLSSEITIVISETELAKKGDFFLLENHVILCDDEIVRRMNTHQVKNSIKETFSKEGNFSWVFDLEKTYPQIFQSENILK